MGVLSKANMPVGGILDSLSLPEGLAKFLLYHIPLPHRPRGKKPSDQSLVLNPQELPPYLSDVVTAVRSGVVTARAFAKLTRPKARILQVLIEQYPNAVDRVTLAELAGQSPTSSGYVNNLGALRSLGLIDYPTGGYVVATDLLFPTIPER